MLSRQAVLIAGASSEASVKVVKPALIQAACPTQRRLQARVATPDVRTRAYDSYGDGGRGNRFQRGRGRQQRGGGGRRFDEGEGDWADAQAEDFQELVSLEGGEVMAAPAAAEGAGDGGFQQQQPRQGRGYGRGGGGNFGYERRGGYGGGGRGYGRGGRGGAGERRWGGDDVWGGDATQQGGGDGFSGEAFQQGEQQQGGQRRFGEGSGGRGYQGQGRRYGEGGGRGRGRGYGGEGGAEGGEQRTWRGPREGMSPEALAARQANNEAVWAAADWRGVAAVLETRGSTLDAENIAAMLHKVTRDGKPTLAEEAAQFETLVASLYGWVSALTPTMRPKQVAMCLHSVAKLELFNAELVGALAARAAQMMGNFQPWEYANMAWAFSRMNFTPGDEWLAAFINWTEPRLGGFKPMELSNTVTALSRLGYVPPASWLDAFVVVVARQAGSLNSLEAVNTLFALASLGYSGGANPGSWLEPLLTARSSNDLAGAGAPAASPSTDAAAAAAGPSSSAAAGMSQGQGAHRGRAMSAEGAAGLGYMSNFTSMAAADSIKAQDLTRATWALTQFNYQPPAAWLEAACKGFVRKLRYCRPSELATISYSLAYLRVAPTADDLSYLASVLDRSWHNLTGDELANVVMSLALWQYRPPTDRWLDEMVIAVRDKLPSCSPDGLTKVLSALPMLGQGFRLNTVLAQAQALLDGAQQQQQAEQQQQQQAEEGSVEDAAPDAAVAPVA